MASCTSAHCRSARTARPSCSPRNTQRSRPRMPSGSRNRASWRLSEGEAQAVSVRETLFAGRFLPSPAWAWTRAEASGHCAVASRAITCRSKQATHNIWTPYLSCSRERSRVTQLRSGEIPRVTGQVKRSAGDGRGAHACGQLVVLPALRPLHRRTSSAIPAPCQSAFPIRDRPCIYYTLTTTLASHGVLRPESDADANDEAPEAAPSTATLEKIAACGCWGDRLRRYKYRKRLGCKLPQSKSVPSAEKKGREG